MAELDDSSSSSSAASSAAAAIVGSWFWQAAEGHNYRWSKAVRSFTRFYESAPMETDVLKLVIDYLRNMSDVTSFELNHKVYQPGGSWMAKDAWFQTVPGDKFEGTESTKVRIYQTLICQEDSNADGPYVVEKGCQYKVSHTFYWDVATLPTVEQSTSGVSYQLQGVTRDRETGLFSCVIEKRERQEQDVAKYKSAETIFEMRQEAQYLGVKDTDVASKGDAAGVTQGVLTERRLTKNADCTTNIENVYTTEESVDNATVEVRKTLRSVVRTQIDRNQGDPLEESGISIGETRRSEKTPGGLYNNTTSVTTKIAAGKIAVSCSRTAFDHEHQEMENVASEPSDASASSAAGGVIHTRSIRKTEEGTFDVTDVTKTEESVDDATVEYRKTLRGTVETHLDRGQSAALDDSGMTIGETRRSELTPGRLYNNTTVKITKVAAGKIAESCARTIFEHEHQEMENVASEPSDASASSAAGGVIHTRSIRKTEEGTFDVTNVTKTEESVDNATVEFRKTLRTITKTTIDRNQAAALEESSGMTVGEIRRSEKTPGGLYNNTTVKITGIIAGKIASACLKSGGGIMHQHMTATNVASEPSDDSASSASVNYQRQRTIQRTEEGWRVENTISKWEPESESESWSDESFNYKHVIYVNQPEPIIPATGDAISCSFNFNGHGSYDGSYTVRNSKTSGQGSTLQWSIGPTDISTKYYYFKKDGKLYSRTYTGQVYRCGGKKPHVASEIQTRQNLGWTGFPPAGWRTAIAGSYVNAEGEAYKVTSVGPETLEDNDPSSGS